MTNEKDRARLTRIAKQWAATLVGSRHVSNSEIATLAEMLEPLLVTVRRETGAIRDTKLIERDGFMCEAHPGLEFEHDPDCPGPGMPWVVESREEITQLRRTAVAAPLNKEDLRCELAFYFGAYHGTLDHEQDVAHCAKKECVRVRGLLDVDPRTV